MLSAIYIKSKLFKNNTTLTKTEYIRTLSFNSMPSPSTVLYGGYR